MERHRSSEAGRGTGYVLAVILAVALSMTASMAFADIPTKAPPSSARSAMPMPGTQEQELPNITFPAPYNVFEFAVTCMACHGGTIDQNVGHGGNWAGTNMASAARDPIFRANELVVNEQAKLAGLGDGAGNLCYRCHSPNGWMSGRYNPKLNGDAQGADMMQSPLLSTDAEGIVCEMCHRAIGNVTKDEHAGSSAYNMVTGVNDWPHTGAAYPQGPRSGDPLGDATLQFSDGMTYAGKYPGSVEVTFSDEPIPGTEYTGQTYSVLPSNWPSPIVPIGLPSSIGGLLVGYNPDGSVSTHFEAPADVPRDAQGQKDYQAQAVSLEHPTTDASGFIRSSEFCGSCHELTVPLGTGMPEQRTYSEWQYSDWGKDLSGDGTVGQTEDSLALAEGDKRCQDCHMPSKKHEYSDNSTVGLNVDPVLAGYFPYGKDRNSQGGTSFHKFAGANSQLPQMMKLLYPEVDLEVIGAPTNNDPRIFPGMQSDRSTMWDRATRNTDVSMREALSVDMVQAPHEVTPGEYEVKVKVTNHSGHRAPSGYPDGRRLWVHLNVTDALGNSVFESGEYDRASATLADSRSTTTTITSANRAMVYEKVTGADGDGDGSYSESPQLLNPVVVFDNRIPPKGFDAEKYLEAGVKFITNTDEGGTGVVPTTDMSRFTTNEDVITYRFTAPEGTTLGANAELLYQTHSRPFMEMLKDEQPASSPRPEGPPNLYDPNYPLTPTYLSNNPSLEFATAEDLDGNKLKDNWGGIAYAAWLKTGKGAPQTVDLAESGVAQVPDAVSNLVTSRVQGDPAFGQTIGIPWQMRLSWTKPAGPVDGYEVWIKYGINDATADWDKIAIVPGDATSYVADELNVGKTYSFRVVPFNSAGNGATATATGQTPNDIPLAPTTLKLIGASPYTVSLSWFDMSDNETGFVVQRQDVGPAGPTGPFQTIAMPTVAEITGGNAAGAGSVSWMDTTVQPGHTYNYWVAAYNAAGTSTFTQPPVTVTTPVMPNPPTGVSATALSPSSASVAWAAPASGVVDGYRIYRSTTANGPWTTPVGVIGSAARSYTNTGLTPNTNYYYAVSTFNVVGESAKVPAPVVHTPTAMQPPLARTNVRVTNTARRSLTVAWNNPAGGTPATSLRVQYKRSTSAVWSTSAALPPTRTSYVINGLSTNTTYWMRIVAVNAQGQTISAIVSRRTLR